MNKNLHHIGLLILRLGFGGLMLTHGLPKIARLSATPIVFPDPLGVGSGLSLVLALIGEVLAPVFIIIGLKTKLATIPALVTMFVAAFVVHFNDPFAKKEMALLYLFAFLVILLSGAGKYSVDAYLAHKKN